MNSTSTALIGRDHETATVRALLERALLVTITGPGGAGKSRLALAVAEQVRNSGPRTEVCELASVSDPDAVSFAVAGALGYPSLQAAVIGLGDEHRLLVVDNCEHVLDAAAEAIAQLVEQCTAVSVLATSREALDLPDEQVLPIGGLALVPGPDGPIDSPAVELFMARAAAVDATRTLPADVQAVVELCRRLDGLPLAIDLAAARTRSMTPREVLTHLDHRLELLGRDRARGPRRHRSLEAAIGWSHDRLPAGTRMFFDRIGVFSGPFTAEVAHAVAAQLDADMADTLVRLDQLVAKSLLTVEQREGRSWYSLLDTLRIFAKAQLADRGELAQVRNRGSTPSCPPRQIPGTGCCWNGRRTCSSPCSTSMAMSTLPCAGASTTTTGRTVHCHCSCRCAAC